MMSADCPRKRFRQVRAEYNGSSGSPHNLALVGGARDNQHNFVPDHESDDNYCTPARHEHSAFVQKHQQQFHGKPHRLELNFQPDSYPGQAAYGPHGNPDNQQQRNAGCRLHRDSCCSPASHTFRKVDVSGDN